MWIYNLKHPILPKEKSVNPNPPPLAVLIFKSPNQIPIEYWTFCVNTPLLVKDKF